MAEQDYQQTEVSPRQSTLSYKDILADDLDDAVGLERCEAEAGRNAGKRSRRSDLLTSPAKAVAPYDPEEEPFPLMDLPEEVLFKVLEVLPTAHLLSISRVCRAFAAGSDAVFERVCKARHWAQPRFPRGTVAVALFPWRSLFRQHACIACGGLGEFVLRGRVKSHMKHLMCKRCTSVPWVQARLIRENLFVDLEGISGRKLLNKPARKKNSHLA